MSPSLKCIPVSVPPTWARSSTWFTAENWPRNWTLAPMSRCSGALTATRGSGAAAAGPADGDSRRGPAMTPPATRPRASRETPQALTPGFVECWPVMGPARTSDILRRALRACDILVLSGGTSKGAGDLSHRIVSKLGDVLVHGVALKPGKPLCL